MTKYVFSIILGILLGFLATKILFLQAMSLIPWGIVALMLGYISNCKKESLKIGALYGFTLGFVFMLTNYSGADPILTKIPFFAAIGIFCAFCALILGLIGFYIKGFTSSRNKSKLN